MSIEAPSSAPVAADLLDERLIQERGLRGYVDAFRARVRSGDLGSLPVIVGLIIIWIIFQSLNSNFLSSRNLVNLTLDAAVIGTAAIGIVLVLLLGEIDLSVGSVAGVSASILTVGFVSKGWPLVVAILISLAVGALIGCLYGLLYTRFGVPSFVITLAGLLAFLGLQIKVLGKTGTINIPFDSWIVAFTQQKFVAPAVSYAIVVVVAAVYAVQGFLRGNRREQAGLSRIPVRLVGLQTLAILVILGVPVWYLNRTRGVGYMFVLFVVLVVIMDFALRRTRWGRSVFAVGGNVEAARRAGLPVGRIYLSIFALCSTFAALSGLLAAGRIASASQSTGGTDYNLNAIAAAVIGGTSLFGGRGSAYSALLGILVIQSISSGLTLLNLDASVRYMITGAVLLLAVLVDSLSRRSRTSHGRA